jgi:asparagine synthetase B (glutamine-hydrolysing)
MMIIYPADWRKVGEPIQLEDIEEIIIHILSEINCSHLSFSGGIDSSLILFYLSRLYSHVEAYTLGLSEDHPDVKYSRLVVQQFNNVTHNVYIPILAEVEAEKQAGDFSGDHIVKIFYKFVHSYTDEIIACDGIDEYMGGYYDHQKDPSETMYYSYLRRLQKEHLKPLHKNSGKIKVYLPYIDNRLILLLSQIPLRDKVDAENRKKIMQQLAKDKIPQEIIERHKYGFCDALMIKE